MQVEASFEFADDTGITHRYEADADVVSAADVDSFLEQFAFRARGLAQTTAAYDTTQKYNDVDATQPVSYADSSSR